MYVLMFSPLFFLDYPISELGELFQPFLNSLPLVGHSMRTDPFHDGIYLLLLVLPVRFDVTLMFLQSVIIHISPVLKCNGHESFDMNMSRRHNIRRFDEHATFRN